MALMAYNRSADLENHIGHIPGNVGSTSVLSPLNQPRSPDEDTNLAEWEPPTT